MRRILELPLTLWEVCRVVRVAPRVERARRSRGPLPLVRGVRGPWAGPVRSARGRRCLLRAIRWVDRVFPDGGNCYRRALLEMALDPHAAARPLALGFSVAGSQLSGHAWVEQEEPAPGSYDFVIQV